MNFKPDNFFLHQKSNYICRKFEGLRKGTKIKAYTIFLSWLMIFAHGIIPHTHFEDDIFRHSVRYIHPFIITTKVIFPENLIASVKI